MKLRSYLVLATALICGVLLGAQSYSSIGGSPIAPTVAGCTLSGTGAWQLCPVGSGTSYQMYVSYNGGAYQLLGATGATARKGLLEQRELPASRNPASEFYLHVYGCGLRWSDFGGVPVMRWFCILALWAVASAQTGACAIPTAKNSTLSRFRVRRFRHTESGRMEGCEQVQHRRSRFGHSGRCERIERRCTVPLSGCPKLYRWVRRRQTPGLTEIRLMGAAGGPWIMAIRWHLMRGLPAGAIFIGSYVADRFLGRFIGSGTCGVRYHSAWSWNGNR